MKSEARLTLDGEVRFETVENGVVVESEVIDGEVVLQSLIYILEKALDSENVMAAVRKKAETISSKPADNQIVGTLEGFFETGTEGVIWSLNEDGKTGYDGLHALEDGDHLKVWEISSGRLVFDDKIKLDWKIGLKPLTEFKETKSKSGSKGRWVEKPGYQQQSALGYWVHGIQTGYMPDEWAKLFFRPRGAPLLRAILTKSTRKSNRRKKK